MFYKKIQVLRPITNTDADAPDALHGFVCPPVLSGWTTLLRLLPAMDVGGINSCFAHALRMNNDTMSLD